MSEFSNNFHLRTESTQEVIEMLRKANLRGYVFKPENGWVSFVIEDDPQMASPELLALNPGVLVHFKNNEDHGFSFSIYDKDKRVSNYECTWESIMLDEFYDVDYDFDFEDVLSDDFEFEDVITINDKELNIEYVYSLTNRSLPFEEFYQVLHPKSFDDIMAYEPAYNIASELNLPHFEWISYFYLIIDEERNEFDYDCIKVDV